jgi:hypothetical protein
MVESGDYDPEIIEHMIASQTRRYEKKIEHLKKQLRPQRFLMSERRIIGGLKNCIRDHGPITKDWIGSAAKRVYASCIDYNFSPNEKAVEMKE